MNARINIAKRIVSVVRCQNKRCSGRRVAQLMLRKEFMSISWQGVAIRDLMLPSCATSEGMLSPSV